MSKLSLETAKRQFVLYGFNIKELERILDSFMRILEGIDSKSQKDPATIVVQSTIEATMMIEYIALDLYAAYRQYLSATTDYEERQAMTKANIVMSEGYKKLYGFTEDKQKESFWGKQIKKAVDVNPSHRQDYDEITLQLREFVPPNLDKDMRDYAVHYDRDPRKVYRMLSSINAEEVLQRVIKFLSVLERVAKLTFDLLKTLIKNDDNRTSGIE
jgi:hypothetical protein